MLPFAIVIFTATNTAGIICSEWFATEEEEECFYPSSADRKKVERMITDFAVPTTSWKRFSVRVLGKAASYTIAKEKVEKALETSNIETDDMAEGSDSAPQKRRPVPNRRYMSSDSESVRRPVVSSDSEEEQHNEESDTECAAPVPPPGLQGQTTRPQPSTSTPRRNRQAASPTPIPTPTRSQILSDDADLTTVMAAMNRLFVRMESLGETQKVMMTLLQTINRKLGGAGQGDVTLPEGAEFPIKSLEDFDSIEFKLKEPVFLEGVVRIVGDVGGRNLTECIGRVMKFLMTNDVCLQFNFIGRNGKRPFGTTSLFEVVYRSVKKNTLTSGVNKGEVERRVGKWLSGGRDRDGNRAKRARTSNPDSQE